MSAPTLSQRIKQTNSTQKDVDAIAEKLNATLNLDDTTSDSDKSDTPENADAASDEDDWEKLADQELDTPAKPVKAPITPPANTCLLELYDFDPRIQMHQLVKQFTQVVDPTGTMSFRPKMVNGSLLLTFNNPKHATTALYNYSCTTPQDPVGKLRRSDGNVAMSRSSSTSSQPTTPASPSQIRSTSPGSSGRPLTTDSVARRFIAGHLGIRASASPERREYDKLVRSQAKQEKEERERLKRKEQEEQKRKEAELRDVWEKG